MSRSWFLKWYNAFSSAIILMRDIRCITPISIQLIRSILVEKIWSFLVCIKSNILTYCMHFHLLFIFMEIKLSLCLLWEILDCCDMMKNLDSQVPVIRNICMQVMFVSWLLVACIGMCFYASNVLFDNLFGNYSSNLWSVSTSNNCDRH